MICASRRILVGDQIKKNELREGVHVAGTEGRKKCIQGCG
jgi:hypothetical protein